jgi:hypothetical protein
MSHIAAERDAERAARERAEAEVRQLREAIRVQADRPIPTLPSRWTEEEKISYRSGWLDRTGHMRDALTFYDAPTVLSEGAELLDTLHDGVYRMEAERDADVSAGAVARTVAMSHIAAERDAERAARERAEAEVRQLRQAVMEAATELGLAHEPEWASPAAKEKGLNPVWCAICGAADGSWPCTSRMVLDDLLAVVAEGAEDRAKFPGLHDRPDTGKECHYLAVTMPHGGLFCNKCGWAEGAEDRGQTHTQTEQPTET